MGTQEKFAQIAGLKFTVGGRSVRTMKKEQAQWRKRTGLEIEPFGDCWINK